MLDRRAVYILCGAIALFAVSLAVPALAVMGKPLFGGARTPEVLPGAVCLAMGWLYLPGWLANPLLLAAAIFHGLRRHRVAIVLLVLALISALAAPIFLASLHDSMYELRHPLVGYYLWVASILVMLVGATRSALRDVDRRLAIAAWGDGHSALSTPGHVRRYPHDNRAQF